jgi:hypothetical protein
MQSNSTSIYMEALMKGGACCWWCSETCTGPCTPMPTKGTPPWGLVGFFCCIGCAKAYMLHRGHPVSYLKLYARTYAGIPFSCPLPCSPPWQTLIRYGPPAGVLTYDQFRQQEWDSSKILASRTRTGYDDMSGVPTRMGRHDGVVQRQTRLIRSVTKTGRRRRQRRAQVANGMETDVDGQDHAMLIRRGPKAAGGILQFFTSQPQKLDK